jgi:hypothetical protein
MQQQAEVVALGDVLHDFADRSWKIWTCRCRKSLPVGDIP